MEGVTEYVYAFGSELIAPEHMAAQTKLASSFINFQSVSREAVSPLDDGFCGEVKIFPSYQTALYFMQLKMSDTVTKCIVYPNADDIAGINTGTLFMMLNTVSFESSCRELLTGLSLRYVLDRLRWLTGVDTATKRATSRRASWAWTRTC